MTIRKYDSGLRFIFSMNIIHRGNTTAPIIHCAMELKEIELTSFSKNLTDEIVESMSEAEADVDAVAETQRIHAYDSETIYENPYSTNIYRLNSE